jgi:hypothetical protein
MSGFDHDRCYDVLRAPRDDWRVEAAVAVGRQGDPATLPDDIRAREAPSLREPVAKLVFEGRLRV